MSYDVLAAELRAAAADHRAIATSLGSTPVDITVTTPEPVGHVELAAWIGAVEEQCHNAHDALGAGQEGLAGRLDAQATDYETTDETVSLWFRQPFTGYTPLFAPPGTGPGTPPVFGPPSPTDGTP